MTLLHMKITRTLIKAINAERFVELGEKPQGQIRIDHNSQVKRIKLGEKDQAIIEFEYTASYGAVGIIRIQGGLFVSHPDIKKIAAEWQESKKMENQLAGTIHTTVMRICVPEAVGIAKDLELPPPIPLPQVRLGNKSPNAKGHVGPEVA